MHAVAMIAVNAFAAAWVAPAIWWADLYRQQTGDRRPIDSVMRIAQRVARIARSR